MMGRASKWVTMTVALTEDYDPEVLVVEAISGRDHDAFGGFVRRHRRWIRSIAFGVLGRQERIDDVEQNVWLAVWTRSQELRDARRWRSWLYRLARNAAIDAGRSTTRDRKRSQQLAMDMPNLPTQTNPDTQMAGDEKHREVLKAVEALPALYREPFVMRHMNGWSYKQIADLMDMPIDTVETRLVRARRFLREALKSEVG